MFEVRYLLEQVWLAHRELGLGPLVEAQIWVLSALLVCWLVDRVIRRIGWLRPGRDEDSLGTPLRTAS